MHVLEHLYTAVTRREREKAVLSIYCCSSADTVVAKLSYYYKRACAIDS